MDDSAEPRFRSENGRMEIWPDRVTFSSGLTLALSDIESVRLHEHVRPRASFAFGPFAMVRMFDAHFSAPYAVIVTTARSERKVLNTSAEAKARAWVAAIEAALSAD